MKNEKITERNVDFAKWYTDVVKAAHLATYSSVKGCIIFEPNGYALWEEIQKKLDKMFKETGHRNVIRKRRRISRRFCTRSSLGY